MSRPRLRVRVTSHPGYPNALPVRGVVERLVEPRAGGFHESSPDSIRLLDGKGRWPIQRGSTGHGRSPMSTCGHLSLRTATGLSPATRRFRATRWLASSGVASWCFEAGRAGGRRESGPSKRGALHDAQSRRSGIASSTTIAHECVMSRPDPTTRYYPVFPPAWVRHLPPCLDRGECRGILIM